MENQEAEEQLRNVIEQQEAQIAALRARVEQLAAAGQQQQQQQIEQQQQHPDGFTLSTEQFLNYINKLRKFNGKDDFTVQEFINSVERAFHLCQNIPGLREYALSIVINDKIQGDAKRCIQRLGVDLQFNWNEVKRELKLHYRPRQDYAELLNECRALKVSTLRELFENFKEVNYKLNELYQFDESRPPTYHPSNTDKYLVDIISSKIHDFLRGNIPENATLIEIYNKFEKLKLLDNEDAVDLRSKKMNKNNFHKNINVNKSEISFNKNFNLGTNSHNNNSANNGYRTTPNSGNNSSNNNQTNHRNNNQNNSQRHDNYQRQNNNRHNNDNHQRNNNYYNRNNQYNNSGQYRNRNQNFNQFRQNSVQVRADPPPEPMEIGNLYESPDVNFQLEPRNQESQL